MTYSVVFAGTPEIACPALDALIKDDRFDVKLVICQPDKPVGRKQIICAPPVKELSREYGIEIKQPVIIEEIKEDLEGIKPDFFIIIAYGQIIPNNILEIAKWNINFHGSILPKYRGASPIQEALLQGDKETGASIMELSGKMDAGPVYKVHKIKIEEFDDANTLFQKIAFLGKYLPDDLDNIAKGQKPLKQEEKDATYCTKIEKKDGEIHWDKETAEEIFNKMRAYSIWPGVFFIQDGKRIKIISGRISEKEGFLCKEGYFLPIKVLPEGKQEQSFDEWKRNHL